MAYSVVKYIRGKRAKKKIYENQCTSLISKNSDEKEKVKPATVKKPKQAKKTYCNPFASCDLNYMCRTFSAVDTHSHRGLSSFVFFLLSKLNAFFHMKSNEQLIISSAICTFFVLIKQINSHIEYNEPSQLIRQIKKEEEEAKKSTHKQNYNIEKKIV